MKIALHLVLLTSLFACERRFALKEIEKSHMELTLEVDTIAIKIDSSALPRYDVYTNFEFKDELFYIGFNKYYYTLDIFNLTSKTLEKKIVLDNQGPNSIKNIEGIFYLNEDTTFIYSRNFLYMINDKGFLIDKVNLQDGGSTKYELVNNYYFKLFYNKTNNSLYFYNLYHSREGFSGSESIVTALDLRTKEFRELPIIFSGFDRHKNAQTGYLRWMNFYGGTQDLIVYNFQFESNI